jgi:hypothetical protein
MWHIKELRCREIYLTNDETDKFNFFRNKIAYLIRMRKSYFDQISETKKFFFFWVLRGVSLNTVICVLSKADMEVVLFMVILSFHVSHSLSFSIVNNPFSNLLDLLPR